MLHEFNSFELSSGYLLTVVYPVIPWIGVMALGYYFGDFYKNDIRPEFRKKLFNTIGLIGIGIFIIIRYFNWYGNLGQWKNFGNTTQNLISFFDLTKYHPSLLYILVTLSCTFLFLVNSEKWKGKVVDFFTVFGRVPFFYYIMHLYLIRLLSIIFAELSGYGWKMMIQSSVGVELGDFGYKLPIVYIIWIGIILMLYPLCKWYDTYKSNNWNKWWLSYL